MEEGRWANRAGRRMDMEVGKCPHVTQDGPWSGHSDPETGLLLPAPALYLCWTQAHADPLS